jgi:hypothetical protein
MLSKELPIEQMTKTAYQKVAFKANQMAIINKGVKGNRQDAALLPTSYSRRRNPLLEGRLKRGKS